jgi:hypothetical protein
VWAQNSQWRGNLKLGTALLATCIHAMPDFSPASTQRVLLPSTTLHQGIAFPGTEIPPTVMVIVKLGLDRRCRIDVV